MRITITIDETADGVEIRGCEPAAARSTPGERDSMPTGAEDPVGLPVSPGATPSRDPLTRGILAGRLLKELKVDHPGTLLRHFKAERIIEVCEAAIRKKDRIKTPAGYIVRALRQGWAV